MPLAPGRPSDGSPRSAMKSGTCSGVMPYRSLTSSGATSSGPRRRARWSSTVTLSLAHWNMSRSPVRISALAAGRGLDARERAQQVVGLEVVGVA